MFTLQLSHPPTSPSLLISVYFIVLSERPPALTLAPLLENFSCPGMVWRQRSRGWAPRRAWAGVSSQVLKVPMLSPCPQWRYLSAWVPSARSGPAGHSLTLQCHFCLSTKEKKKAAVKQSNSPHTLLCPEPMAPLPSLSSSFVREGLLQLWG